MRLPILVVTFVVFTAWSSWLTFDDGLAGLTALLETNDWGKQIFADLCISLFIGWGFLRSDAKKHGLPSLPYVVATPFLGSIAVLAYLIHRELRVRSA